MSSVRVAVAAMVLSLVASRGSAEAPGEIVERLQARIASIKSIEVESQRVVKAGASEFDTKTHSWLVRTEEGDKTHAWLVRDAEGTKTRLEAVGRTKHAINREPTESASLEVSSGTALWIERRDFGQVSVTKMGWRSEDILKVGDALRGLEAGVLEMAEPIDVDGEPCTVVRSTMRSNEGASGVWTVAIGNTTGLIRRAECMSSPLLSISDVTTYKYRGIDAPIDDALFVYAPPPGARVQDLTGPIPGMGGQGGAPSAKPSSSPAPTPAAP